MEKNISHCRTHGNPLEQDRCIAEEKHKCDAIIRTNKSYCPAVFDGILCWDEAAPNTESIAPCPSFFAGFNIPDTYATKRCTGDGQWYIKENTSKFWTNYSQCFNADSSTVTIKLTPPPIYGDKSVLEAYLPVIKYISQTGYFISFSTLVVAFCIMFYFKKLHCARNKLHMHLFASFIFRAAMSFIKDILFFEGVGLMSDIKIGNGTSWFNEDQYVGGTNNWECKFVVSLWQYFITANYSWILMEGVYLHNLILFSLFSDSNNSIIYYILFGWGLPAIVITAYVGGRLLLDDTFCWTVYEKNPYIFLIIRLPTMISIVINVALFINIARVLLLKLKSPITEETRLFRRWARSTLVLVPLFGVHYAIFLGMSYSINNNITVEIIWLFCDQLFASFQGFFVAVLYCFLNGEVKTELRPHINSFLSAWQSSAPFSFLNCGEFSRSTAGRPSVCTTLSCSSLYTSSVNQRYPSRKSKWDITQANGMKTRHSSIPGNNITRLLHLGKVITDRFLENYHICHPNEKTCPDHSNLIITHYDSSTTLKCSDNCCYSSKGSTQLTDISEITACLGQCDHKEKTESSLDLEMITMVNH